MTVCIEQDRMILEAYQKVKQLLLFRGPTSPTVAIERLRVLFVLLHEKGENDTADMVHSAAFSIIVLYMRRKLSWNRN